MINKLKDTNLNNAFIHMIHLKSLLFFYFNEKNLSKIFHYIFLSKPECFWFSFVDFLLMKKDCIQLKCSNQNFKKFN